MRAQGAGRQGRGELSVDVANATSVSCVATLRNRLWAANVAFVPLSRLAGPYALASDLLGMRGARLQGLVLTARGDWS